MSQGTLKGLLSFQLLMGNAQLLIVVNILAACDMLAAAVKEWLTHIMTISKV